jgi:MFS family permease
MQEPYRFRFRNAYMIANPKTFSLSHMHSFFCIGALTSPLVCQSLIARGWEWQRFYYISAALPVIVVIVILLTFRPARAEYRLDREIAAQIRGEQGPNGAPLQVVRRGEVRTDVESMNTERHASRHSLPRNSELVLYCLIFLSALPTRTDPEKCS